MNKVFDNFIKKRREEYISCNWLEYGIHFTPDGLFFCDKYAHKSSSIKPVATLNKDYTYDFNTFEKTREQIRKLHRNGKIIDRCNGCILLQKKKWDDFKKIRYMAISTNTSCNSNCIYCYTHRRKKYYNNRPDIPILEYIKSLIVNNLIDKNCEIQIGGGEPTLNKEFELLMKLMEENEFNNIRIYSSGINYSKSIEILLQKDMIRELIISPDAGSRELYKQIKGVDKFEDVWSNIKRYSKFQNVKKDQLKIKYIIIPNINDREEDVEAFVDRVKEADVFNILIDIEMNWYKENINNIEEIKKIFKKIKNMEKYIISQGLEYSHNLSVCCAIAAYHDLYDSVNSQ